MVANFYQQEYDMYYGHFNFENGCILVVLFIATPAKTKSLFKYCIKIQSQPMTVVKYNNCESIGQNTTEYRSDRRYLGWVGEIITSIRRYLWQHGYGRGPLFILCY
jgi:hypothetical protein